jgi:3-phosphoshikimate 1-carboxyvinyltransferase
VASGPVDAVVRVPGSKSVTNRALVLAATATGPGRIRRPLRSRDTELMAGALRALGAGIAETQDGWAVTPLGATDARTESAPRSAAAGSAAAGAVAVDVGNAGTVLRFVPPLAGLTRRRVTFDGDPAVRRRPVGHLLAALRSLGVEISGERVPFDVAGHGAVPGGRVEIDASGSSQLVSALLLAAPRFAAGVEVVHTGERAIPNAPHLAMTVDMLRRRGVEVDDSRAPRVWRVAAGPVAPADVTVEPDLSSAAPYLAAAVATGGRVRVAGWPAGTTQPGRLLPDLLQRFGAAFARDGDDMVVTGSAVVTGADVDLRDCGELTPVIAALAALASTPSRLSGIDYLRGHETDRLAALSAELGRLGAEVTEEGDGLRIVPKPLRGSVFSSYDDHRMVMAAAVLGLAVPGIVVDDAATVAKTYPRFTADWAAMLATGRVGL